jgi:hypothetical protein
MRHFSAGVPRYAPSGGASYSTEVLADSPRWWLRLDESSGNFIDEMASLVGTPSGVTYGVSGHDGSVTAASFDGVDDYVQLDLTSGTYRVPTNTAFTYECWANIDSGETSGILVSQTISGTSFQPNLTIGLFGVPANEVGIGFRSSSTDYSASVAVSSIDTVWTHIVGVYDGSDLILYIDGAEADRAVGVPTPTNNTSNIIQLGRRSTGANFTAMDLADVAAYPSALSATRILAHYNAG